MPKNRDERQAHPGQFLRRGARLSGGLDLDLLLGLLRLRFLRKRHRENALLEARFDLVGFDAFRNCEAALEGAEEAFMEVVIFLLLFLFFPVCTEN